MEKENLKKYIDGLDMNQFKHIKEKSQYNHNYYIGFNNDLLLAESDDDNTTEWYIILNNKKHHIGYSYSSKNEILHLN